LYALRDITSKGERIKVNICGRNGGDGFNITITSADGVFLAGHFTHGRVALKTNLRLENNRVSI